MTEHIQINDVVPRIHYDADGVQRAFTYPFAIFKDTELEVWLGDCRQSAGYSVSGAGISTGGSVLLAVPPPAGTRVMLRRRLALERVSDYQTDGIIRAKTLNDELDYQVAAVQQVADDVSRCIQRPVTSGSAADLALPDPEPGKALGWSDDGSALVNDPAHFAVTVATVTAQAAQAAAASVKAHDDRLAADADASATAADRMAVAADRIAVHADREAADADAAAIAADRVAVTANAASAASASATAQTCRDQAQAAAATAVSARDAASESANTAAQGAAAAVASGNAAAASAAEAKAYATQAQAAFSGGAVKVSSADTAADYLGNSLSAGSNIALSIDNAGANEKLRIGVTGLGSLAAKSAVGLADTAGLSSGVLVGRTTAGTGAMEAVALGSGLSLSSGVLSCTLSPVDTVARDQAALANLRLMLNSAVSSGVLVQGYQWELGSDEWGSGSSNYLLNYGPQNYYSNQSKSYATTNAYGSGDRTGSVGVSYGGNWGSVNYSQPIVRLVGGELTDQCITTYKYSLGTNVDAYLVFSFPTQVEMNGLRIYADAVSAGGRGTWIWQGCNDSVSWSTIATFNWSNSGTGWQTFSHAVVKYQYYRWYCVANPSDYSGNNTSNWVREFEFYTAAPSGANAMTLVSPTVTVSAVPSAMDLYFLWAAISGSPVVGTDLLVDLSRDGGTTWSAATISVPSGAYYLQAPGNCNLLKARADVSGQPTGTAMKARIRTTNTAAQLMLAPALYKE